ncbi:hypothetical protein RCL1_005605 [Eukaryota sp. TZLM3-RCL]
MKHKIEHHGLLNANSYIRRCFVGRTHTPTLVLLQRLLFSAFFTSLFLVILFLLQHSRSANQSLSDPLEPVTVVNVPPYNLLPVHLVCTNDNCTLNFLHWIQIRSIESFINHSRIYLHVFGDPIQNYWFNKLSSSLSLVYHNKTYYEYLSPKYKVTSLAHLADFIRFDVMCEHGGIYLDMDEIPLKSWDPLLSQLIEPIDTILGEEPTKVPGLQIAAMIAYPKSWIMCEMSKQQGLEYDNSWIKHSIKLIRKLHLETVDADPQTILVHGSEAFVPIGYTRAQTDLLYRLRPKQQLNFENSYALHVSEKQYLRGAKMSVNSVLHEDRNFYRAIRPIVTEGIASKELKLTDALDDDDLNEFLKKRR